MEEGKRRERGTREDGEEAGPNLSYNSNLFDIASVINITFSIGGFCSRILQSHRTHDSNAFKQQCNQVPALWPSQDGGKLKDAYDFLFTKEFENASIARLSGAVQVKTESKSATSKFS